MTKYDSLKKVKIAITLDSDVLKLIDSRRGKFCMKRSSYINFRLRRRK